MPSHQTLDGLCEAIETHPVFANSYFDSLQRAPWTRDTYALHRANFFYRTELTVKTIAHVCARAADEDDVRTLILFTYILNEECGNGQFSDCHAVLMEGAHNTFGRTAFDLDPLPVTAAGSSPLIAEGTKRYRKRLMELAGGSYQRMLGVAMALESHASRMLTHCRTAFRTHASRFDPSQFVREVEVYFNVHLERGVEERHASDATECVRRNCRTAHDLAEVSYGAMEMLNVQLDMWQDLHQRANAIGSQRVA